VVRRAAGEWPGLDSLVGSSLPIEDTICQQLLEGRIGNVVADVQADIRVRHLAPAAEFGVGAWIGVPIEPADAELYMLCCLAREARPSFGEREVRLLRGLAESVRAELQTLAPSE
jgi:GAF domain-containing protein